MDDKETIAEQFLDEAANRSPIFKFMLSDIDGELEDEEVDQGLDTIEGLLKAVGNRREKAFGADEVRRATDIMRAPFEEFKLFDSTVTPELRDKLPQLAFAVGYEINDALAAQGVAYVVQTYLTRAFILSAGLSQTERITSRMLIGSMIAIGARQRVEIDAKLGPYSVVAKPAPVALPPIPPKQG